MQLGAIKCRMLAVGQSSCDLAATMSMKKKSRLIIKVKI